MGIGMDKLTYDPTDANSIAASSTVGSYVLAGDDGTAIGHVSDALKVNFTNSSLAVTAADLDIRDLAFATDKVDVSGSTIELGATTLAALESITVSATDLDIRNLAFATDKVDVSGSTITVNQGTSPWVVSSSDSALANTTALSTAVAPTTTATNFPAALANRKYLTFQNLNGNCFVGGSTVTASTGLRLASGAMLEGLRIGPAITLKHVMASGTGDLRIFELS
jgi:hypothetical protein